MGGNEKTTISGPLENKLPDAPNDDWSAVATTPSDTLPLEIRCEPGELDATVTRIEDSGGTITSSYGRTILVDARADIVRTLASLDGVRLVSETIEPKEFVTSEGVTVSNMDSVHNKLVEGNGAKIAVVDAAFDPSNPDFGGNVVAQLGDPNGYSNTDELHGTGCAEVVHDMAPKADLVLAVVNTSAGHDLVSVLDEIENKHPDTDVATMSLGFAPTDRLDGLDDLSNRIQSFTDNGRLFTVAAGNEADGTTWHGPYRDSNSNDIMEFDQSGTEYLKVNNPDSGSYIIANWDDWPDDNQAYTLRIYDDQSKTTLLDEAGPTAEPWEAVQFPSSYSEAYIEIEGVTPDQNQQFDLWIWGGSFSMEFAPHTKERSISIPATSQDPNNLAVAAVQATDYGIEPNAGDLKVYSSRGPTRDGRQGIDIAGPSRVSQTSNGYGQLDNTPPPYKGFNGTSAAAPHIGGAVAALFEFTAVTNEDIREALLTPDRGIADSGIGSPPNHDIGETYLEMVESFEELIGLNQQWSASIGARAQFASPGVDNNHVFVGSLGEDLVAYDRSNGTESWRVTRSGSLSDSSPVVEESAGLVYVGSGGGTMYALNTSDGSIEWSKTFDSAITSTPVVEGSSVCFGLNDGRVIALSATDGTQNWIQDLGQPIYSGLDSVKGSIFVTTINGNLYALDSINGAQQWNYATQTDIGASSPHVANGSVYLAADDVYAFQASDTRSIQWTESYGGTVGSSPTFHDNVVYVGSADGNLYALDDTSSGSVLWQRSTGDAIAASPTVVGKRIFVPSLDGNLYIYHTVSALELGSVALPSKTRSSPSVDSNDVYLGTRGGTFVVH